MPRAKSKSIPRTRCHDCARKTPDYDIVHYGSKEGGYRPLCSQCLSAEIARADGIAFEHIQFDPVELADCEGVSHTFHIRTHLFGPGVALDAFELRDGSPAGYRFQVIGKPEDDLLALLGQLVAKIRRALSVKHLETSVYGLQIADRTLRGSIHSSCDREAPLPVLVIDGREISWRSLGHMLMTFEGFQFKLEIRDKSEEV